VSTTTERSREERSKLRRELRRFDTIFFLISAMVVVDTIGAIAVGGAQAFSWLLVLFVFFFIPSALASAELGAALPEEGGAYVWVRRAFGRFAGGVTSLLYWAGTPMWLGGSVTVVAIAVVGRFFGALSIGGMWVFGTFFIVLATVGAVIPLRYGKWVPTSGALTQIALLVLFVVTVGIYATQHGVHGIAAGDLAPSYAVFIAVVPILLYSFVGVELPTSAAEEMVDPRRDIPVAIGRAGVGQLVMYAVPILAVLLVLPPAQLTSLHGLIDAMKTVFTVYGGSVDAAGVVTLSGAGTIVGDVSAIAFVWVLLASGSAWIMGAGRAQAAACLEGGGPQRSGASPTAPASPSSWGWCPADWRSSPWPSTSPSPVATGSGTSPRRSPSRWLSSCWPTC
jgi:amino acid transporter